MQLKNVLTCFHFFLVRCGHCKNLAPIWNELSVKYNEKDTRLIIKVDCTIETSLCKSQDIAGYPTLKFFKSGVDSGVEYSGVRDFGNLDDFIREQLGLELSNEPEEATG